MATRTRAQTPGRGGTPVATSARAGTPSSSTTTGSTTPLSPTRRSRIQEKHELQNLNDRLASYIDRVRSLESENQRLSTVIHTHEETLVRETETIREAYGRELDDARRLLDETHLERSKLQVACQQREEECGQLRAEAARTRDQAADAEHRSSEWERKAKDAEKRALEAEHRASENGEREAELREARRELARLKKQVEDLRRQVDQEALGRIEVENKCQSLQEDLSFNKQLHQQQLAETRVRRQTEISEIDGRLAEQYENRLQEALQELREDHERALADNRREVQTRYEAQLTSTQANLTRAQQASLQSTEELRNLRVTADALNSRVMELENTNRGLIEQLTDLETRLNDERRRHTDDLAALEAEIERLRRENADQMREYSELMDVKVSLDLEISAYRKLLESEESRLNINARAGGSAADTTDGAGEASTSSKRARLTPARSVPAKRKRTALTSTYSEERSAFETTSDSQGDVDILDVDAIAGRFVTLRNRRDHEVSIGAWRIDRSVDGGLACATYKFRRAAKLEAGATATVWSAGAEGARQEPPTHVTMKTQTWPVGERSTVTRLMSGDEEKARHERTRHLTASSTLRESYGGGLDAEQAELLYGQAAGEARQQGENCCVM